MKRFITILLVCLFSGAIGSAFTLYMRTHAKTPEYLFQGNALYQKISSGVPSVLQHVDKGAAYAAELVHKQTSSTTIAPASYETVTAFDPFAFTETVTTVHPVTKVTFAKSIWKKQDLSATSQSPQDNRVVMMLYLTIVYGVILAIFGMRYHVRMRQIVKFYAATVITFAVPVILLQDSWQIPPDAIFLLLSGLVVWLGIMPSLKEMGASLNRSRVRSGLFLAVYSVLTVAIVGLSYYAGVLLAHSSLKIQLQYTEYLAISGAALIGITILGRAVHLFQQRTQKAPA